MKKTRVARTLGELRVTRSDGTVEVVNEKRATEEARRAVNKRDRELKSPVTLAVERSQHPRIEQGVARRKRAPGAVSASDAIEVARQRQREIPTVTRRADRLVEIERWKKANGWS